ncbi:hypothetical protein ABZ371_00825 [Streptomyces sp. NPDC005899]|uniref:hypothetical protein n=1 Tax=Streptomyces sp. NPDC005899 TaxID=3155716 RepID=UPI003407F08E
MSTAAADLRTIATTWTDLHDALGAPSIVGGFGRGLSAYLAAAKAIDTEEIEARGYRAAALRLLERDPQQLGDRPTPIRLGVYETMRTVEAALVALADQTAAVVQRPSMCRAPRHWPAGERRRRDEQAEADALDPRRWRYTGARTAPYAALWLLGRVQGGPGPFRPLGEQQYRHVAHVAAEARRRIEHALDTGAAEAELSRPCPRMIHQVVPCGGTITVYGGAGTSPLANCDTCGGVWTEQGAALLRAAAPHRPAPTGHPSSKAH